MFPLKLIGLLLLTVLVSSDDYADKLYQQVITYQDSYGVCQSVCDSLLADNDTGLNERQMAVHMFYATANSETVIDVINAMGNYTLPLKKKFINTWITMKLLKAYTAQVSKKFRQNLTMLLQKTSPGKTRFCQPCVEKNLAREVNRVSPDMALLNNEKIDNDLKKEVKNKPLIGSEDTSYILRMERDPSVSSSSSWSFGTGGVQQ